jgi:hypothetical protein
LHRYCSRTAARAGFVPADERGQRGFMPVARLADQSRKGLPEIFSSSSSSTG